MEPNEREVARSPGAESGPAGAQWARRTLLPTVTPRPGIDVQSLVGNQLHVSWIQIAPDTELPTHQHPHEQIGVVLDGAIDVTIAGEVRRVEAGEAYAVPGGVEHSGRTTAEGVQVLETFTPIREDYLAAVRNQVPPEG